MLNKHDLKVGALCYMNNKIIADYDFFVVVDVNLPCDAICAPCNHPSLLIDALFLRDYILMRYTICAAGCSTTLYEIEVVV